MSISKAEFAREVGVSKPRVTQLIKEGLPLNNDGTVKVPDAHNWYDKNVLQTQSGPDQSQSITALQAKKLREEAEIKRLDRKQRAGELVDRQMAERAYYDLGRQIRDAIQTWPAKVSAEMANELGVDPHKMQQVLDDYVYSFLNDLAHAEVTFTKEGSEQSQGK